MYDNAHDIDESIRRYHAEGMVMSNYKKDTPIETLIPYARNARTHSDAQVSQIAASIREFGFCNPVLIDKDGGIIAGHGRVLAAQKLGLKELPTITLGHLNETQKRAYILADNKLALNAGWDEEMLKVEITDVQTSGMDLVSIGFSAEELGDLFDDKSIDLNDSNNEQDKDVSAYCCPKCGFKFEVDK